MLITSNTFSPVKTSRPKGNNSTNTSSPKNTWNVVGTKKEPPAVMYSSYQQNRT